jgi:hypothetical protein
MSQASPQSQEWSAGARKIIAGSITISKFMDPYLNLEWLVSIVTECAD